MSFSYSQSSFVLPGFDTSGTFTVSAWQQYDFEQSCPLKKLRDDESLLDNVSIKPQRMPSSSIPINNGTANIFFKTRVCAKFKLGLCRNGEKCNFAHGVEDLRQPPPNWQELVGGREEDRGTGDDGKRITLKMKLCKRFVNGEVCPYGDRCNFLHEDSKRCKEDTERLRESSAIKVGTASGHGMDQPEADPYRMNIKTEANGFCSFGDNCGFAHGRAELKVPESRSVGAFILSSIVNEAVQYEGWVEKKDFSKLKGSKKINRIYADWIDDLPLDTLLT